MAETTQSNTGNTESSKPKYVTIDLVSGVNINSSGRMTTDGSSYTSWMMIYINTLEYNGIPALLTTNKGTEVVIDVSKSDGGSGITATNSGKTAAAGSDANKVASEASDTVSNIFNASATKYRRTNTCISFPVPNSVQFNYGAGWQPVTESLNALGLITGAAVAAPNGEAGKSVMENVVKPGLTQAVATAASKLAASGASQETASAITKFIFNPFTEQAFTGMARRSFNFEWVIYPRNKTEATALKDAIKTLRYHMHPELKESFLLFPSRFDIEFYHLNKQMDSLPKIATCVLKSLTLDYSPNGMWAPHEDGEPSYTSISCVFEEIYPLVKKDIESGF
jgi:hypothetical protein